ncbi:MAG TPA: hypothetical protein VL987_08575 [Cellvibrio sp.]|nr:hypothetical protein [Cellvibrio sp.]
MISMEFHSWKASQFKHIKVLHIVMFAIAFFAQVAQADDRKSASPVSLIGDYKKVSFSPIKGERFDIPIVFKDRKKIAAIEVDILTEDNDLVRSLKLESLPKTTKKSLVVVWDGKDQKGEVVPDEAYFPMVRILPKRGKVLEYSAKSDLAGEEVYKFDKKINPGSIEYDLPETSRVLIRSGIFNGPMLRTIVDWEPRTKGFHVERWNGRDSDSLKNIESMPDISYLVIGYRLPESAILTYGNASLSYKDYRQANGWPIKTARADEKVLERNGRPVRPEYYLPIGQLKSAAISVDLTNVSSGKSETEFKQFDEIVTSVSIAKEDEFYLDQSRYEISFFVDNVFIAEEEQGFVPFKWRWSPGRYGIQLGEHTLTVNVSSYNGQVTVKNMRFVLKEDPQ